jgi:hypothetical protein
LIPPLSISNMSRASTSQQRGLTLTEELEKLEQSITLTLQGEPPHPILYAIDGGNNTNSLVW